MREPKGQTLWQREQITAPRGVAPCPAHALPWWHPRGFSGCPSALPSQTRTFLSPEEVLKGLQGEIEEVLGGISLSVNVLRELFLTYDFCCTNMKLFFKVRARRRAGQRQGHVGHPDSRGGGV